MILPVKPEGHIATPFVFVYYLVDVSDYSYSVSPFVYLLSDMAWSIGVFLIEKYVTHTFPVNLPPTATTRHLRHFFQLYFNDI